MSLTPHPDLPQRVLATVSPCLLAADVKAPSFELKGVPENPPLGLLSVRLPEVGGESSGEQERIQRLDLLMEFLLRTREAFVGRRSWLGRRLLQVRTAYNKLRVSLCCQMTSL